MTEPWSPQSLVRTVVLLAGAFGFVWPSELAAQGCALCYTQAAGSSDRFIQALRGGILILVLPPLILSCMFALMAYRRRNAFHDDMEPHKLD